MMADLEREFKSLPHEDWDVRVVKDADGSSIIEPVMSERGRAVFEALATSHGLTGQAFFEYLMRLPFVDDQPANDF